MKNDLSVNNGKSHLAGTVQLRKGRGEQVSLKTTLEDWKRRSRGDVLW
jgi:hypothetical protein